MKKLIISLWGSVGIFLIAGTASATSYVCIADYVPGSTTLGSYGYVGFSLYTGTDCSGSYVGSYYLCSSGATSSLCCNDTTYLYTSTTQLMGMAQEVINAAQWNLAISSVAVGTCNVSGSGCAIYLNFD
jgi:hypothetical protein